MSQCDQLRPYLDGEMKLPARWRMQRHLRECPACKGLQAADGRLGELLRVESVGDTPADAAAIERLTRQWTDTLTEERPASVRRRFPLRRLLPASAAGALAVGVLVVGAVTAPSR